MVHPRESIPYSTLMQYVFFLSKIFRISQFSKKTNKTFCKNFKSSPSIFILCPTFFWSLEQVRLGQIRLGQVSLGQFRLGLVRLGQVRFGQVRLGQVRLDQIRLGQVSAFVLVKTIVQCSKDNQAVLILEEAIVH